MKYYLPKNVVTIHVLGASCRLETCKTAETAVHSFIQSLLKEHKAEKPLHLHMDMRQDLEEREKALLCFYKRPNTDWACPFECTLHGKTF